jgi:FkbM family methyltransferase
MTPSKPYKDYSQSGEQTILINTFDLIPASSERWCVEFGAWDGKHFSNTYNLISHKNWNGVLIESDSAKFELLKSTFQQNAKTILLNKTVNFEGPDSLDKILVSTPIPHDFDLLSIDVDGNDWHIWESIEEYRPKIVVIDFNPSIPSDIEFVQPKDLSINQGTSLLYIVNHAKAKGYELFNTTKRNAFFIHKALYPKLNIEDNSIQALWKTEKQSPRVFQLYDGTLVLDKEFKMRWRQKTIGQFDLQVLPESERMYQPKQSPNRINSEKLQRFDFLQNSIGVIHIGANSGQERDIYQMHKLAVLWVEADPDTYITLEQNVKTYPNQTAVQSLLLDRDGIDSPFYISTNHAASSSIYLMAQHKKFWPRVDYANEITLKSESLTTLVNRITLDLTLYDTMVLDTQGSELRVLQGGVDILWGIHTLLIETSDCELYQGGCYDSEIAEFLKPFGFVEIERWVMKSITGVGSCYNVVY